MDNIPSLYSCSHQEKPYLLIQKIKLECAEICHNLLEQAANMWPKLNQLNQLGSQKSVTDSQLNLTYL